MKHLHRVVHSVRCAAYDAGPGRSKSASRKPSAPPTRVGPGRRAGCRWPLASSSASLAAPSARS
eukprot:3265292-Alexandrium_andersonii.AAC.1